MSELPVRHSCKTPTARRKHQCCECRGLIQPGEKYHVFSGLWSTQRDAAWDTFKTCDDCEQIRDDYIRESGLAADEIPPFGDLRHCLRNDYYPLADTLLARLEAIVAKRRISTQTETPSSSSSSSSSAGH